MSKLKCYLHQAGNGWRQTEQDLKLQEVFIGFNTQKLAKRKQIDASTRTKIQEIWSLYSSIPVELKPITLDGILHFSCISELSYLSTSLHTLTKVNFLAILPKEICFKILNHLDATSLCRAAQVCSSWRSHADSDVVWKRMCSQHIDKRCDNCGWGLPLMTSKRQLPRDSQNSEPKRQRIVSSQPTTTLPIRSAEEMKVIKIEPLEPTPSPPNPIPVIRSWKEIFAERSVVARNWRKLYFNSKNLIGHTDGVMGLFYDDSRSLLLSASEDHTLRAWNTDSGLCLGIFKGHTGSVRSVQFDASKIVSCSMDKTIRIWSLKTFECVRVIEGTLY
jgi:F-box/WD-40 domain protein MET30